MKRVNHPLHIVLSILTGGLWLIPYAAILAGRDGRDRRNAEMRELMRGQAASREATRLAQEKQGASTDRWWAEHPDLERPTH